MLPIVFEIVLYNVLSKFCHTDMYGNELHDTQYDLQSFFIILEIFRSRETWLHHIVISQKCFVTQRQSFFLEIKVSRVVLCQKTFDQPIHCWLLILVRLLAPSDTSCTIYLQKISNKGSLWLLPPTTTRPVMTRIRRWSWWRRGGGEVVGSGDQVGEWRGGKLVADTNL